jgi:basic amino acid/polyamine antiporter, APA family
MDSQSSRTAGGSEKPKRGKFLPTYGLCSLILLGFGNTIGSGVFTLTGVAAKTAGSAVFLGFIISGVIALLTALVFAEFASMIPKSGSAYVYTYSTFGELPAWIVGWNQNLRYGGTTAVQSRGWSSYIMQFFAAIGLALPKKMDNY